jgi:hypothetical protein
VKDHGFGWGYTWTKLHLQWRGLVAKAPRKGAHRTWLAIPHRARGGDIPAFKPRYAIL